MNIMNKLTLRLLKENKRRTIVTMIGVIISVAMLTAVSTIAVSFFDLMKRQEINNTGEWHVLYQNVPVAEMPTFIEDSNTKQASLSKDLGYAKFNEPNNDYKPYLFIKAYNETGFNSFPVQLVHGKLPEKQGEIVLSEHFIENEDIEWEIGDTIKLPIGQRMITDDEEYYINDQSYSLFTPSGDGMEEVIREIDMKEYTITGIIARPQWEPYTAPGYTVITYLSDEQIAQSETVNISTVLNKVSNKTVADAEALGTDNDILTSLNYGLLRYEGYFADQLSTLKTTLIGLSTIIMSIIVVGSVSLIYNAFAISVSERSRYLGMLASVGATKKQKRISVYFEGAIIGLISIPIGIICGIGAMGITFIFINDILHGAFSDFTENLQVTVTAWSINSAILVSIITIFIATYIPAKRASKITAIDAIRQTEDVKLTKRQVKTNRLTRKIFGMEADFALKNLKRNKRRYQVTVYSLVISIILFLSVSYFTTMLQKTVDFTIENQDYDIVVHQGSQSDDMWGRLVDNIQQIEDVTSSQVTKSKFFRADIPVEFIPKQLFNAYYGNTDTNERSKSYTIELHALDDTSFQAYVEENDLTIDVNDLNEAGLLVNQTDFYIDGVHFNGPSLLADIEDNISFSEDEDEGEGENENSALMNIEIAGFTSHVPVGVYPPAGSNLVFIVPEATFNQYVDIIDEEVDSRIYIQTTDPIKTEEKINEIREVAIILNNTYKAKQQDEQLILLMQVFVYGFIALITAISIANIFNTIATSMMLRRREFGMLKSVGMTPKSFRKMIIFESAFYGIKSLAIGLPISGIIMYGMFLSMKESFDFTFFLPWSQIGIVIVGIFAIVGFAMLYAMGKIKNDNIIEALKQENT